MSVLPAATPRTSASYGAFVFDETTGCLITTPDEGFDKSEDGSTYFEFDLRLLNPTQVVADDDAAFGVLLLAVQAALKIPRQRLLIRVGGVTVKDLNPYSTALMIQPELTLLTKNARDFHFGFRVTCGYPGNVPGNLSRRDSLTRTQTSIRQNRVCRISASWTASAGKTAQENYQAQGDDFYNAFLPTVGVDQYGNVGSWQRADEDPAFNDEQPYGRVGGSVITVTREYWELFWGRKDSLVAQVVTIGDRKVLEIPSVWASTPDGFSALQNYVNNGGTFFTPVLAANPPSVGAEWVLVSERFGFNDQAGEVTATRVYHEVIAGLREAKVNVATDAAGLRTLTISGVYYDTASADAKTNYKNNVQAYIDAARVLETPPIQNFESHSVPKITQYDQNNKRLSFTHVIRELNYPQGPNGYDNANVTFETLELEHESPYDAQSISPANPVTRLGVVRARFSAIIDKNSADGDDPVKLWNDGLADFVLAACVAKLGTGVTSVEVTKERVGPTLHNNGLFGFFDLIVTGGSVLWCEISQEVSETSARDFVAEADGNQFSEFPFRKPAHKFLFRECWLEYVINADPAPVIFKPGDQEVSGFALVDTGITAADSLAAQKAAGTLALPANGWFCDFAKARSKPTTRGSNSDFQTVLVHVFEVWHFVSALAPGTTVL